jgi:hypothetical protein
VGLSAEDWNALKQAGYSRYTEKERAALTYAEKLTRTPYEITDADVASLKNHFSDAEVVDLHLLVGVANLTNRFTDPLGLEWSFQKKKSRLLPAGCSRLLRSAWCAFSPPGMIFLFYDTVVEIFAGFSISLGNRFRWLSVDWTSIFRAITCSDDK